MRYVDWSEFLKNANGKESADRLLFVLSFIPATAITAYICTVEALGVYLTAYGAVVINNKWADKNATNANSEMVETTSDSVAVSERVVTRTPNGKGKVPKR